MHRMRVTASAQVPPGSPSSAPRPSPASARPSMRLSELGELGLLAELERRRLIVGVENDAAQLAGGFVVTSDVLVVTGPRGAAGAAFRSERHARPPLRLAEGRRLARDAHAMLDISDGIAVDAAHLARRSRVRCVVELDAVPLAAGATIDDLG